MAAKHRNPPTYGLSGAHNSLSVASKAHFSAWTPVNHLPSNEQLYQERRALIGHWYDMWTHGQRQDFLRFVLQRSTDRQQRHAFDLLGPQVPAQSEDFADVLPRHLTMRIFSFLDARSLCRASSVNWRWHFIAEQDWLWHPKCTRYGWYLPYTPGDKEYGAWKRHYVSCLNTLDRSSPNKQVAMLYSSLGGVPKLGLGDPSAKTSLPKKKRSNGENRSSSPSKSLGPTAVSTYRPRPWLDPDPKPKDLQRGWKLIQTQGAMTPSQTRGLHHSTFSATSKTYSLASAATLAGHALSGTVEDSDSEGAAYLPGGDPSRTALVRLSEILREQEAGAYDSVALSRSWPTYSGPLNSSGFAGSTTADSYVSHYKRDMQALVQRYPSHSHPSVMLISSQIPAPELLVEGLIFGVLPLVYDYDSSTLQSLVDRLDYLLAGRQARSVALFVEASEGDLQIVSGETSTSTNVGSDVGQRYLWESLCSRCIASHDGGRLDLFTALASNAHGMELMNALQRYTGYQISASRSLNNKREFVDSEWVVVRGTSHTSQLSPPALYFNLNTLATWTSTCLYLENASSTARVLLKSYLSSQRQDLINKAVGKLLIDTLSLHQVSSISRKLSKVLVKAVSAVAKEDLSSTKDIAERFAHFFNNQRSSSGSSPQLHSESNRRPYFPSTSTPVGSRKLSPAGIVAYTAGASDGHGDDDDDDDKAEKQASVDMQSEDSELELASAPPAHPESPAVSPVKGDGVVDGDDSTFLLSLSSQHIPSRATATMSSTNRRRRRSSAPRVVGVDDVDASHDWMEQRHGVAMEIGRTEKVYSRCLLSVHENFATPLKNAVATGRAIVSATNIDLIFTDTEVLLEISKQTDGHLQSKLNDWSTFQCLGDVFARFTSSLQSYMNFANNYPTTLATIMRCREESPAFRAFLKQQSGQAQAAMLSLFELLLLPGQRITSYLHLLNTFKVLTPPDHPDHQLLDVSIGRLERMKGIMLEAKERSKRERRLESLQKTIIGCPVLQEGQRYLQYEETFQQLVHCNYGKSHRGRSNDGAIYQHIRDVGAFLFSDSLMLTHIDTRHFPFERATCTTHLYSACFALESLQIIDMKDSKYVRHTFTVATADSKHRWILRAQSYDVKLAFIAAVQKASETLQPLQF